MSAELQKLLKLKFDRRPSTFLQAWAKPELKPIEEDPKFDEKRKEIADLEAEIAATPVPVPATPPSVTPEKPAEGPATEPTAVPEEKKAVEAPKGEESAPAEEPAGSTVTLRASGKSAGGAVAPTTSGAVPW